MIRPVPMMLECGHWMDVHPTGQAPEACDDCVNGVPRNEDIPLPGLDTPASSS